MVPLAPRAPPLAPRCMSTRRYPDGHVFYRRLARDFPRVVRGEGCWLVGDDGRRYLDGCGGAFAVTIGHGVAEVADAIAAQARRLAYVNGTQFTHDPVEELAAELAALAPGDLELAYPLASGSEATEAALKLARQYWAEAGRPDKHRIVALAPAYHGNTLLALSASARPHYTHYFGAWLVDVIRVPAPYAYRCACGGAEPFCPACSGSAPEEAIVRAGPGTVAAFVAQAGGGA